VTAGARCLARANARHASMPTLDLLPFQQITREETAADLAGVEPWPQLVKISPELIAYHKHRAHRLRSRAMRRAIRRAYRRMFAPWRRLRGTREEIAEWGSQA
jgi:hypothetical protein